MALASAFPAGAQGAGRCQLRIPPIAGPGTAKTGRHGLPEPAVEDQGTGERDGADLGAPGIKYV